MTHWREVQANELSRLFGKRPLTERHRHYQRLLAEKPIVVCTGPAGTGKTALACEAGARMLKEGRVERLVLVRPMVTCGRGMGYLKGDLDEKVAPYLRPLLEALGDSFGRAELERLVGLGTVELGTLDLMRGRSIRRSFVVADEMQNAEGLPQLHMLLTRPAEGTTLVLTGDLNPTQVDTGLRQNPLGEVVRRIRLRGGHGAVGLVELGRGDVLRSGLTAWVDELFDPPEWVEFTCPACRRRAAYDNGFPWQDGVELVLCPCGASVEPWDGDEFAPRVVGLGGGEPARPI